MTLLPAPLTPEPPIAPAPGPAPERDLPLAELAAIVVITALSHVWSSRFVVRSPPSVSELVASFPSKLALILLIGVLLRRRNELPWPPYKPARNWLHELATALSVAVLAFSAQYFTQVFTFLFFPDKTPGYWSPAFRDPLFCALWPFETFFAAIYEELVFRVYLPTRLARTFGASTLTSLLVASALFAVSHGYSASATAGVFMVGLVLGAAYNASRSLPCVVLAHWGMNLMFLLYYR
jgi:membrane protease YdiL (CAAX protease family)